MNAISKPHLVDLLRIFDKRKYLIPRIRYASVRSKPELIRDLKSHFKCEVKGDLVEFKPRRQLVGVPRISYDLVEKRYRFDGRFVDVPRESRQQPVFEIRRGPFVITFPNLCLSKSDQHAKQIASVSSQESLEQGIRSLAS